MAEIKEMAEKIRQAERGETPDDAAGRAKAAKEKQERRGIADEICKRIGNRTFEYTNRPCIIGAGHVKCELATISGEKLPAIAFRIADSEIGKEILSRRHDCYDVVGNLRFNRWNNSVSLQFILTDIKKSK